MTHDYRLGSDELLMLTSLVGKRLESYRLNNTDNTSYEIFVLRFQETDIEFSTREIVGIGDWFDETNVVEVAERRHRDSWSRVGKTDPDNGIPPGEFRDYAVNKVITGISVIGETFSHEDEAVEFVRGIIVQFGSESIVFDKGAYNWECIWSVRRIPSLGIDVRSAEFDPVEEPGFSSKTRIERLA